MGYFRDRRREHWLGLFAFFLAAASLRAFFHPETPGVVWAGARPLLRSLRWVLAPGLF